MANPTDRMSEGDNAPVSVTNPKGKKMAAAPKPSRSRSRRAHMADAPAVPDGATGPRMDPVPTTPGAAAVHHQYPDMQPKVAAASVTTTTAPAVASDTDGYVRMRLVYDGAALTLTGMKAVAGPLVEHAELHGEMAYEVTVGSKRVATGPVVDLGPNRAFPPQGSAPGSPGHMFVAPSYQEVVVRVPRRSLTLNNLARTNVSLLRIKEGPVTVPSMATAPGSLSETHEHTVREVTRLAGIRLDDLPDHVRAEVHATLS